MNNLADLVRQAVRISNETQAPGQENLLGAGSFLQKSAAPAWVKMLQAGKLSPESLNRITSSLPVGTVRQVKHLGQGSGQIADLMAGNVGTNSGLFVRKLPKRVANLDQVNQNNITASEIVEKQFPGIAAKYFPAQKAKGVFQEYGETAGKWPTVTTVERMGQSGVRDLHPANFSSTGKIIDYQYPLANGQIAGDIPTTPRIDFTTQPVNVRPYDIRNMRAADAAAVRKYWLGNKTPIPGEEAILNAPVVPSVAPNMDRPSWIGRLRKFFTKTADLNDDVELQDHQQRLVNRMQSGDNRMLVYHGLGSGKSLSSLATAEAAGGSYGVVAPASLRQNYQKEVDKFTTGSNPEILSYTGVGAGKQFQTPPDTIIADEAHRLRNPNAASTQGLRKMTDQSKNLLLLTGTPITNEPSDLASLLSLIHKKNITPEQFNQRFVGHKKVYPSWWSWLRGRNAGEEAYVKDEKGLRELLKGVVDYQPSKTPEGVKIDEQTVRVPLSPAQTKIQKAIRSKIPPGWGWKLDKEFPLTREELSSLNSFLTGLRQSSLSTQPFRGDKNPINAFRDSTKLQRAFQDLKTELDSDPRKKGIVYSNYIDAGLNPYAAALAKAKIPYGMFHGGIPLQQRKQQLNDYNSGKLRALLLGPAAAEGISTKSTNMIQLLDPHWHESRTNQAKGRGLRFDSHIGLPEDLRNVAVRRYISESQDPSLVMRLLGVKRQRTGDEILESLTAQKEKRNDKFRKILQEEGTRKRDESKDG